MSEATTTELVTVTQRRIRCRHVHLAGLQCGSPALRREQFCYYHHATRRPKPPAGKFRHLDAHEPFELPVVEDRASALSVASQILSRIASNDLDPARAGRLLYNLQVVAAFLPREIRAGKPNPDSNLPDSEPEPALVEELIDDEVHGPIAPITDYIPPTPNPVNRPHPQPTNNAQPAAGNPQPATIPTLQAVAAPPPLHWKTNVHANRPSRPHPARFPHRSRRQVHLSPLRPARRPR